MELLSDVVQFAAKALIVFFTFAACVAVVLLARARRRQAEGRLEIKRLDHRLENAAEAMREAMMTPREFKRHHRRWIAEHKARQPRDKSVFVLDFDGDVLATAVEHLREEISAVLQVARPTDEVVVRLESPGGAAHSYGFAASQLGRLRDRGIKLTACVDRIAASGGYMMACVADQIVASPFAIVGSIGVAAPLPNVHRLLQRHGVDFENFTAGKYKRTVSVAAPITEEGRRKFQEQLDETHGLFKGFVQRYRPVLDIDAVATGEHWHGLRAAELKLVDRLLTSDDYLLERAGEADLYRVRYHRRRKLRERLTETAAALFAGTVVALYDRWRKVAIQ